MNENNNQPDEYGYFRRMAGDEGVQRGVAAVVVAVIVASAKDLIFGKSS